MCVLLNGFNIKEFYEKLFENIGLKHLTLNHTEQEFKVWGIRTFVMVLEAPNLSFWDNEFWWNFLGILTKNKMR